MNFNLRSSFSDNTNAVTLCQLVTFGEEGLKHDVSKLMDSMSEALTRVNGTGMHETFLRVVDTALNILRTFLRFFLNFSVFNKHQYFVKESALLNSTYKYYTEEPTRLYSYEQKVLLQTYKFLQVLAYFILISQFLKARHHGKTNELHE